MDGGLSVSDVPPNAIVPRIECASLTQTSTVTGEGGRQLVREPNRSLYHIALALLWQLMPPFFGEITENTVIEFIRGLSLCTLVAPLPLSLLGELVLVLVSASVCTLF